MHLSSVLIAASLLSAQAIIMPISKQDGTLDISSLVNHLTLLEQKIDNKTSESDTAKLESQLQSALHQLTVAETKASTALEELKELRALHYGTQNTKQGITVYTRWGRKSCPQGNNEVYKGYTAGSHYTDKGGIASILCLAENPIHPNITHKTHDEGTSHIWGTQYGNNYWDQPYYPLHNNIMPCVVCETNRSTSFMVPGRNACYQGWTLEYSGYLLGGRFDDPSSDAICVDVNAEPQNVKTADHKAWGGNYLYPVESKCGSLSCPPYIDGGMIHCSVCSK